jgi:DNA transformation protein and related proteins
MYKKKKGEIFMEKLSDMPNIGSTLEKKLMKVDILDPETLKQLGSKEAFIRIRNIDDTACLNMLCALEGAVQGMRWHGLSPEDKKDLKDFFQILQRG